MRLKNKIALLSGVGERFGKATAYLFAREGAHVVLLARKEDVIKQITQDIISNGGKASFFVVDATNDVQIKEVIQKIISKYNKIDVLFTNVGGSYTKRVKATDLDNSFWEEVIINNLKSTFLLSKYSIPHMSQGGSIITVAASFKTMMNGNNAYSTAKGGIIGLTKNLAKEYAHLNIRVNSVCPGVIRENTKDYNFNSFTKSLMKKGQSEDVAYAVLFLASDESSWITGQTIVVDGGEEVFVNILQ